MKKLRYLLKENLKSLFSWKGLLVAGFASFVIYSHYTNPLRVHYKTLEKYSPLKENQKDSLFNQLNLNSGLREFIKKIYILENENFDIDEIAHTHKGIICLKKNFNYGSFFHESGHVRKKELDALGSDFSKKWEEIANFDYGEENFKFDKSEDTTKDVFWKDGTVGSKYGMMRPYSSKSVDEDVACFVEELGKDKFLDDFLMEISEIKKEINKNKKEIIRLDSVFKKIDPEFLKSLIEEKNKKINREEQNLTDLTKIIVKSPADMILFSYPIYFADTTDKRYQKKLDLLREYNFLTEAEHEVLSKNLGSLNYLIKDKNLEGKLK